MLRQASLADLICDRVSRERGHVVITMRYYPRFVPKEVRDEYIAAMAPQAPLLKDFLKAKRASGGKHNAAFKKVRYQSRFQLSEEGMHQLERLAKLSRSRNVYLVCQCKVGERCHREMLLMVAEKKFGAKAEKPRNEYKVFERRIARAAGISRQRRKRGR